MFSFRCKTCGRLETSGQAAEALHPHACRVCGSGVIFDSTSGLKTLVPENWEDLHAATDKRLAELGLSRADVEKHVPWPSSSPDHEPQHLHVEAFDGPKSQDKAK